MTENKMIIQQQSAKQITFISIGALILGHLMIPTNLPISFVGFFLASFLIYYHTLHKNDFFSFIMVIYFTNHFYYFNGYGGGFNIVAFLTIFSYLLINKKMPFEVKSNEKLFKVFTLFLLISSILGWSTNFVGKTHHLVISGLSFIGIILLLLVSSRLLITKIRIVIFLKISFILVVYSIIASINKYINFIPFDTPMLPKYALETGRVLVGGGILNSSSIYGEHSMLMLMLFTIYLLFGKNQYLSKIILYFGVILSFVNVFFSISRSVFILTVFGLIIIIILQYRISKINIHRQLSQIFIIIFISFLVIMIVNISGLGLVFERLAAFEEQYEKSGGSGFSLERVFDGSVFGRKESFDLGYDRYYSKDSWLIGFGWGTTDNNRFAFYVDTSIRQGTAHSQIFAILFLFGWVGLIAYFGLYLLAIFKSFSISGSYRFGFYENRLFAFSIGIILLMYIINEIKIDSISYQYYFGATIILLGLSFANINTFNLLRNSSQSR